MTLFLYVLRQLCVSIAFALGGLGVLVLPAIAVRAVQKLGGAGVDAVLTYVPLVLIDLVPYLVPIAFLLGVVATFGRLAADGEWTAIQMAGVHPLRMLLPGAALALIAAIGTHHVLGTVAPEWKFRQRSYLRESQIDTLKSLGKGRTQFSIGEFFVDAARTDGAGTFSEAVLGLPPSEEGGAPLVVIADSMRLGFEGRDMVVSLSRARALRDDFEFQNESPYFRRSLDDLVGTRTLKRESPKYLTDRTMRDRLDGLPPPDGEELSAEHRHEYRYEIHRRAALSATYAVFLLLGAAVGLKLRSGTQLGAMTAAIGIAFLYYILSMELGKELGQVGLIAPEVAAWATDGLYLAWGAWMARRVLWR